MGRAPCCSKLGLKRGAWSPEEDRRLMAYVLTYGHSNWRILPKLAGLLRCGKSARLRWINYLRPDLKCGDFTKEEEQFIVKMHAALGNKWSTIASHLPGRTDNEIKNHWNTYLKKRLPDQDFKSKTKKKIMRKNPNKNKEKMTENYENTDPCSAVNSCIDSTAANCTIDQFHNMSYDIDCWLNDIAVTESKPLAIDDSQPHNNMDTSTDQVLDDWLIADDDRFDMASSNAIINMDSWID